MITTMYVRPTGTSKGHTKIFAGDTYLGWIKHYGAGSNWYFYPAFRVLIPNMDNRTRKGLLVDIEAAYGESQ